MAAVKTSALAAALLLSILPSPAFAADPSETRWGVSIWGLSYHPNTTIDYTNVNLGVGLRYYATPHVFIEADALRDSNRGLTLPASVGAEIRLMSLGEACHIAAIGALTVAYYQNPRQHLNNIKFGPLPGVTVGCHRVQVNIVTILSPSAEFLAAIVASLTVRF